MKSSAENRDPQIQGILDYMLGRPQAQVTAFKRRVCVPSPIGCGQLVTQFRDEVSEREYEISGLCQSCQDKIFGEPDEI